MLALADDAALARLMIAASRGRGHARAASNGLWTPDILRAPTKHRRPTMPQPRRYRRGPTPTAVARRSNLLTSRCDGCTEALRMPARLHVERMVELVRAVGRQHLSDRMS